MNLSHRLSKRHFKTGTQTRWNLISLGSLLLFLLGFLILERIADGAMGNAVGISIHAVSICHEFNPVKKLSAICHRTEPGIGAVIGYLALEILNRALMVSDLSLESLNRTLEILNGPLMIRNRPLMIRDSLIIHGFLDLITHAYLPIDALSGNRPEIPGTDSL